MTIPTEPAVHAIAKALWVDHGNNPDNWVYNAPEEVAHYFRVAQIAYNASSRTIKAEAWQEGFKQGGPMHDEHYGEPDKHKINPYRD